MKWLKHKYCSDLTNAKANFDKNEKNAGNEKKADNCNRQFKTTKYFNIVDHSCRYEYRGLQNKGNDCWLNSLLQCINHMTIRKAIMESARKSISPLILTLIQSMKATPFYPVALHEIFQNQFHYIPHTQNDIHESFTRFLVCDAIYEDVFTDHFQLEIQYIKLCPDCQQSKKANVQKLPTVFISVDEPVSDVSDAIY